MGRAGSGVGDYRLQIRVRRHDCRHEPYSRLVVDVMARRWGLPPRMNPRHRSRTLCNAAVFFVESQIVSSTTLVGLLKVWKREEMSPRWQERSVTENMR